MLDPAMPPPNPPHHRTTCEGESPAEKERKHFKKVILTFKNYAQWAHASNIRRRVHLSRLEERHRTLLPLDIIQKRLDDVDEGIRQNQAFLNVVVDGANSVFAEELPEENEQEDSDETRHEDETLSGADKVPTKRARTRLDQPKLKASDFDKLKSTLKQFVRDWSVEGLEERTSTYGPIISELLAWFKNIPMEERGSLRVLVPGAGLGRLAFDIAKLGFSSQGNEFSFYMLLSSYFILNRPAGVNAYTLRPWIHTHSNVVSAEHQLRIVSIPDVPPGDLPPNCDFSMVAGDFLEVYDAPSMNDSWDSIVTCFFIDTAGNIAHYLQIIHKILKPGGLWINLGPLLYHFEDIAGEMSIELTLEEVLEAVKNVGFEIKKQTRHHCTYAADRESMLTYEYNCAMWVAVKSPNME